jgi:hypothetical protein
LNKKLAIKRHTKEKVIVIMDKFEQVVAKVDGFIAQYPSVTQYGEKSSVFREQHSQATIIMLKCVYV